VPRYIAFLRAINVGGHVVKMDHLRRLFEALSFEGVETFIASGNVIFSAPGRATAKVEQQIEQHLAGALGYAVATFLRTPAQVTAAADYRPFAAAELRPATHSLYAAFLKAAPAGAALKRLMALRTPVDDFHAHGREVYWLRRREVGESTFTGAALEKALGAPATMRNITTVQKLAARYGAD
jgi:uncharacterized protein (DUF1697 family)